MYLNQLPHAHHILCKALSAFKNLRFRNDVIIIIIVLLVLLLLLLLLLLLFYYYVEQDESQRRHKGRAARVVLCINYYE